MPSLLHRFPRLRVWGPIVLGLLIFLVGTVTYLQTRHGFRHVVVPLVEVFLPGALEVRDGFVDLPDTLEVEGLRYVDLDAGVEVVAERAFTVVSVLSLLGSGPPVIDALEVTDAKLALMLPQEENQPETAAAPRGAGALVLLPLVVKQGRIDGLDVSIRAGDATTTMDQTVLTVEELAPGGRTQLTLGANWRYHDAGSGDAWAGSVDTGMTVSQSPAGDALEWSGTASIDLVEAPTLPLEARAVTLKQALEGSYDHSSGVLRATSSLQIEQGEASLAAARSELSLAGKSQGQGLTASLTIDRLTAAALNLALAGRAEAHFETADIKGRVDVRGAGDRISVQSSVEGERIRVRLHDSRKTSPMIALSIQQAALLDRSARTLRLETLDATVSDGARAVLVAKLDRPLTMRLDRALAPSDTTDTDSEAAQLSVTLNEIGVDEIHPWLALTGGHLLDDVRKGSLHGRITATVRRQAETVELVGSLRANDVMIETPPSRSMLGPLRLEQDLRATLTNLETLQVESWETSVKVKNKSVGRVLAAGAARVHPELDVRTLSARLTLNELPAEMLNPLLAGTGGTRIARARLDGTTRVDVTDEQIVWDASFHGKQISLAIPDAARPSAPVDIQLAQSGRFDRSRSVLTLPTLDVKVLEGRRLVLEGSLDQPLTLDMARSSEEGASPPALQAKPVRFNLNIHQLSVEQLRPRLALLGSRALDDVSSGVLDGRLKIDVLGQGDTIDVAGQLDASNVRMRDAVAAPLTFRTSLEGSVAAATRVALKTFVVRVMAGPKELFLFQGAGSTDMSRGAVNATAHAFSVDVTNALRRVGWLSEQAARRSGGGELSAKLQVVATGSDQPLAVTGEAKIGNLRSVIARGKTLTRTLTARLDLGVNGERTLVTLNKIDLGVEANGRPAGVLTVTGQWPLAHAEGRPRGDGTSLPRGEVVVKAKELDGAPLVVLLDLLPGRALGLLPVSIDATVSHEPASRVTRVRGRETIGPLSLANQQAASAPTTIHLEHDLTFRGEDDMEVAAFTLTSERPSAVADEVKLKGKLRLGVTPRLELRGDIAQLDAAWYADLFSAPAGDGGATVVASGKQTSEEGQAKGQAKGQAMPLALPLDLDVDTSIGTITYRTIVVGKGRFKGKGTGDRADLTLEPTGFAGGMLRGTLAVTMKKGTPHLAWSAEGKDIEVNPILQAFQSPEGPQLKGRAAFTTNGKGQGQGAALERSLSGTAVIDVTDGEFLKSKLLTYTAKQTGVSQFEGMKFSKIHGELTLADGWIHVTQLRAQGPGLALKGTGKIGWDGQVDVTVTPSVTGELAQHAKQLCIAPLLRTVDDLTEFPFAVKVSGTVAEPKFGMTVTTAGAVARGVGGLPLNIFETLKSCGGGGVDVLKGAGKLLNGLLGGGKKQEKSQPPGQ